MFNFYGVLLPPARFCIFSRLREQPPHFAASGTFEHSFAFKWKELYAQHAEQKRLLEAQFEEAARKLEMDEMDARAEHQTALMREGCNT